MKTSIRDFPAKEIKSFISSLLSRREQEVREKTAAEMSDLIVERIEEEGENGMTEDERISLDSIGEIVEESRLSAMKAKAEGKHV